MLAFFFSTTKLLLLRAGETDHSFYQTEFFTLIFLSVIYFDFLVLSIAASFLVIFFLVFLIFPAFFFLFHLFPFFSPFIIHSNVFLFIFNSPNESFIIFFFPTVFVL
jgi:hypothetical protein